MLYFFITQFIHCFVAIVGQNKDIFKNYEIAPFSNISLKGVYKEGG